MKTFINYITTIWPDFKLKRVNTRANFIIFSNNIIEKKNNNKISYIFLVANHTVIIFKRLRS